MTDEQKTQKPATKAQKYDRLLEKSREAMAKDRANKKAQGLSQVTIWTHKHNSLDNLKPAACYMEEYLKKHFLEKKKIPVVKYDEANGGWEFGEVNQDGKYTPLCKSGQKVAQSTQGTNKA